MPYINVNDVYILNNTGEQVDDAVDYALANSNRNLLDNPFFSVNQRGYTSGSLSTVTYWADRWLMNTSASGSGSLSLSDGVVTLTAPSGSSAFGNIYQRMENPNDIDGKVVTLSALLSNGTVIGGTITRVIGTTQTAYNQNNVRLSIQANNAVVLQALNGASVSIKAMKLEVGPYSTILNDVPPKKRSALADCQERFLRLKNESNGYPAMFGYGVAVNATTCRIFIPTPVSMGTVTDIVLNGAFYLYGNASNIAVTNVSVLGTAANGVLCEVTASGLTAREVYTLMTTVKNNYIDLIADF